MHNIEYQTCLVKGANKKSIESNINWHVKRQTYYEGGHGLDSPIIWKDRLFDRYEDAREYIENNYVGHYEQVAVKYLEYPKDKNKKLEELMQKLQEEVENHNLRERQSYISNFKSAFIGCSECGSRINKNFIKTYKCPVCNSDMRSKSTLDALKRSKDKINSIQGQISMEKKKIDEKNKKRATENWLIKYEYHT